MRKKKTVFSPADGCEIHEPEPSPFPKKKKLTYNLPANYLLHPNGTVQSQKRPPNTHFN